MKIDPKNIEAIRNIQGDRLANWAIHSADDAEKMNCAEVTATLGFLNDSDRESTEAAFEAKITLELKRL